jgi:glycosyltransferase involved in cell wall biosynthesis
VSVIVAARNEAKTLPRCLASLAALDYPDFEVIVVDDGSRDDTRRVAEHAGVRVADGGGRGASAARNAGAAIASGDVLAFTDADCEVPPHWLRALVPAIAPPDVVSAGGPQHHVFPEDAREGRSLRAFFACAAVVSDYTRHGGAPRAVSHNASCNSAYDRAAFLSAGGFTLDLWPGEDVDLDRRLTLAGHRHWFVPDAVVRHLRPSGAAWFRRMMRRYGRGQGCLVRRHGFFRRIDVVPLVTAVLLASQLLWLVPALRPVMIAGLALAVLAAVALLVRWVPLPQWVPVMVLGVVAVVEWHLGYVTGLMTNRTASPSSAGGRR